MSLIIWNPKTGVGLDAMSGGVDLNGERRIWQSFSFSPGGGHEHRQDAVRPARQYILSCIHISDGKLGDVHMLDVLVLEAGVIYLMDRSSLDFARLYVLHQTQASSFGSSGSAVRRNMR
jgi:hypothetical protein